MYNKLHNKKTEKYKKMLKKLRKKLKNIDFLVIKKTETGVVGYSKPCCDCIRTMKYFNINKVYYSTGVKNKNGIYEIKCERISNIKNTHQSQMTKNIHKLK